jgi:predicted dehydrogenase
MSEQETASLTRRDFLKTSAVAAGAATLLASGNYAFAAETDKLRLGIIGCGGRGTGAVVDNLRATEGVNLVAMADVFPDRLNDSKNKIQDELKKAGKSDRYKVTDASSFTGLDAYKKLLGSGIDLVILATPPGFRPLHLDAAIKAGKHVFMEKPVAVDPTGVRSVIASSELAGQKKLGIVAGSQRRHQLSYVETLKRIHDGAIGDVTGGQVYWNQGGLWAHERQPKESDLEWQIRNWLYFPWLSGDHIVEQHVHNLDVMNWVLGHPESCVGMGGRQVRNAPVYGNIFDHFTIDYSYPNGVHVMSMCRQIDNTASNVSERFIGTKGQTDPSGWIKGENNWRYDGPNPNPYEQEHADLVASIRSSNPLNEGRRIAESTLIALMGRMSAYTGQEISWDEAMNSKLDLMPNEDKLTMATTIPVGPVPMPGKTALV